MNETTIVVLVILGIVVAQALWKAARRVEELEARLSALEREFRRLAERRESAATAPSMRPAAVEPSPAEAAPPVLPRPRPTPPPLPTPAAPWTVSVQAAPPALPPPAPARAAPSINWEQFMGVKLFAWVGGLALFLGVAFFVKYSFDNNLVSPELRVAIGFVAGLALLAGGTVMSRRNYAALSQTLCATGVLILYAVTFACRSIYHFEFFGAVPTFLLMVLITTTAFLLAVRLEALVVAILGMLGGFLTPILLSTGQDNPWGLFGYIAILDTGLILVASHRRWSFLAGLAALGTALMETGWAGKFFVAGKYFEGNKILVALAVLLGFNALFLAAGWRAKTRRPPTGEGPPDLTGGPAALNAWLAGATLLLAALALAFAGWFLDFPPLARRPWLMFGFVFLIDLVVAALARIEERAAPAESVAGLAVFGLLGFWTLDSLDNDLLNAGLACYFLFAVFHSLVPVLLRGRRGPAASRQAPHWYPILTLALVLLPVFRLPEVSFLVWPFILLVDLLAIALAVLTAALLPVLAVLALTLAATAALILKIPSDLTGLPTPFFLIGGFAVFFVVAGAWLMKKFKPAAVPAGAAAGRSLVASADFAEILPACSIVLPFLLLIMAALRLPLVNPSPVFGLALLLVVLLLGVTKLFSSGWMPAIGLACVASLECAWHFSRFDPANPNQPVSLVLTWYLIFYAAFTLFPFLFLRQFSSTTIPWAASAMAGPPQFFLVHRAVAAAYPNQWMGLLPAAFAIPSLLGLVVVLRRISVENKCRLTQLAWFGGAALFFITLIFPVQFERQWITIGWALEGAALLWLFHRVPHPGLRLAGFGLLVAAFVRLAFNPAVLEYHRRAETAILNWYLYAYGLAAVCLFAGARLLAPPRHRLGEANLPAILAGLGTTLSFLLLNIEIADYFSVPGSTLTFQFNGNFARDMTYSIAWALFALVLLVAGILRRASAARYAAMGLLCVTLLKLFFHDLAQLGQLYRIGAFIGVAAVAMLASFAYQKFFTAARQEKETDDATLP